MCGGLLSFLSAAVVEGRTFNLLSGRASVYGLNVEFLRGAVAEA